MTDFEKSIKRNMTRDKFLEIRDHRYGDGNNFFNYTYGDVSSWLTWNRDEKGQISKVKPPDPIYTKRGNYYDGPINDWEQDKLLPVERQFSSRITTDIVFVGLNLSGDGTPLNWPSFQNARGHPKIVNTFSGTEAEGAYFTDIIKPDKRFLDEIGQPANSQEVMRIVKSMRDIMREHISLFKEELDFIGADKPLLIVFGNDAEWILTQGLDKYFLSKRFHAIVNIYHYSKVINDERYKEDTRLKLAPYITIPKELKKAIQISDFD